MSHAAILPILLPMAMAVAMLLRPAVARPLAVVSLLAQVLLAALLLGLAGDDAVRVYRLGDWPAPYGIVLVLAERIQKVLGERFVVAVERLMGLILVAVAVEMLLRGLKQFIAQLPGG